VWLVAAGVWLFLRYRPLPVPEPEGLIPQNVLLVGTMDTPTLWPELAPMFQQPPLDQALPRLTQATGIDLEKDVLAWAGPLALSVGNPMPIPSAALLIRIRDGPAFEAGWQKIRAAVEKHSGGKFQEKRYEGCPISVLSIPTGQGPMGSTSVEVALAQVRGYAVVGFGSAAVQEIVDVGRGKKPSLARQESFAAVRKEFPPDPALLFTMDYSQLTSLMSMAPGMVPSPTLLQSLGGIGMAVVEEPERARLEVVAVATGEEAKALFRRAAELGPVRGSTLTYVPETALGVYLYHNLAGQWALTRENLKTMLPPPQAQALEDALKQPQALFGFDWESLVSGLTGETGLALLDVGEKKMQALVVAEAQDAPTLTQSLQSLQPSLQKAGCSLKQQEYQGTAFTAVSHPKLKEAPIPLTPCYAQIDRTLLVASDTATLKAALDTGKGQKKSLRDAPLYRTIRGQLPKQTQGLVLVDLRFLTPLWEQFAQVPEAKEVIPVFQSLGLDRVKAIGAGATLTETRSQQTVIVEGGNALHTMVAPVAPLAAILVPVFGQAREKAHTAACQSNLKQIGLAAMRFEQDQGHLPDHRRFEEELEPYLRNPQVFRCASAGHDSPHYRMNAQVSRKVLADLPAPAETILAFECDAQGKPDYRHDGGLNLVFVDGRVKWVKRGTVKDGLWTPPAGD